MFFSQLVLLIAGLSTPISPPTVECFQQSGRYVMESPAIELVFSGRVVEYQVAADAGYRATFDVDRVWKGTVPKRIEIHVWQLDPDSPSYEKDGQVRRSREAADRSACPESLQSGNYGRTRVHGAGVCRCAVPVHQKGTGPWIVAETMTRVD